MTLPGFVSPPLAPLFRDDDVPPMAASTKSLSALDQLHAEQKSTIEALTYQIEFYRQREDRAKRELDTLRAAVQSNGQYDVARLASENRVLGDEVDALRSKQRAWGDEKRRLQRHQHELEQQLQDARQSLASFTQAVEQLELKMQRRDAEEQTRALEMEQELRQKEDACAELRGECEALKREIETLTQATTTQRSQAEMQAHKMQNELHELQRRVSEADSRDHQRDTTVMELQTKLVQATSEASSLRVELEKKMADIRELEQKLERSTELLELREKLLTSDASSKQERESQVDELRRQISTLEREKDELQQEVASLKRHLQTTAKDLETMKSRVLAKDHSVMVATLRSEVAGVKERLRAEFKHEKEALQTEKALLSKEISLLQSRLSEKERFIHRLQEEMLEKQSREQCSAREVNTLKSTIHRLESEVASAQKKYQQLLETRSSLAEQLDFGFKELLEDEDTAASLLQQVGRLQQDLGDAKQQLASSDARYSAISFELQAAKEEQENVSAALRRKIEELHDELRKKDQVSFEAKQLDTKLYVLEQDKRSLEASNAKLRALLDDRMTDEQNVTDKLQDTISALKAEKAQQHAKILAIEDKISERDTVIENLKSVLTRRDAALEASAKEIARREDCIRQLNDDLTQANSTIEANQEEKGKRERKLLRERRLLEEQVAKLVNRIESASTRNGELGDKIISMMKQLKGYETEIIALQTQLKAEKKTRNDLDRALASVQRSAGQDAESSEDLKRRLHEITSLKETYQNEVHQLKCSLDRAQNEKDVVHRQRDEAIKRVSMLMKCQEQMKSTVETHTAELIEEIETLQSQLDDEQKRTTVLLSNEKTLLRDINEKNSIVTRLQQSLTMLQQQQRDLSRGAVSDVRKASPRDGRYSSFPSSTSPTAGGPTTPKTQNSSEVSSSTQELDRLLGSLERISEFSTQSPSTSFTRQ